MLLMTPLFNVVIAWETLQQEEMERKVLVGIKPQYDSSATLEKNLEMRCSHCGNRGHEKAK